MNSNLSQPLREAVSWNALALQFALAVISQPLREAVSWNTNTYPNKNSLIVVSLFVRLWVEINQMLSEILPMMVSLFVRLWVEIYDNFGTCVQKRSASSWGCELKCRKQLIMDSQNRQPLREAVSWNIHIIALQGQPDCQPLREAVSWNTLRIHVLPYCRLSASSWGCELKCIDHCRVNVNMSSASSWGCELKFREMSQPVR